MSESSPGRILDCDKIKKLFLHSFLLASESSPGRILDCDDVDTRLEDALGEERSESSPGRILDCDVKIRFFRCMVFLRLNHLQGEYWIATLIIGEILQAINFLLSESSPGRILDCDPLLPPLSGISTPVSESSPGRILDCDLGVGFIDTSSLWRLNHLQGEYWIATFG